VKSKNWKEKESLEERGTRRYIERIIEEKLAEQEIKEYIETDDEYEERVPDGFRPERI
jgi:hypothetical protein